jgi:hypothetical protein
MAASGPALADTGVTAAAAAAPTAAAAAASATATTAASSQAAVAATYCEAAKASLPTAEGAMRRTRAAARKDVVATATVSSAGAITSPSPPAPPAKRKRKRPQPVEPTSGQSGAEAERMDAIPQLDGDGDVSLGAETASLPATPPPPPLSAPLVTTMPLPPNDSATVKNLCRSCNTAPVFNYERSICIECLEKLVCKNCFTRSSEYRLKYQFFKYIYDYCQVECKK